MTSLDLVYSGAELSADRVFRYEARRIWDLSRPRLVVCMLNPSTADEDKNDPTVLTLCHFGKYWGYGGLQIVNDRAFRASRPADLYLAEEQYGPLNRKYLRDAIIYARGSSGEALAAWGNAEAGQVFTALAKEHEVTLVCLGTTQNGSPKHPLARGVHRIPRDQQPIEWKPPDNDQQ